MNTLPARVRKQIADAIHVECEDISSVIEQSERMARIGVYLREYQEFRNCLVSVLCDLSAGGVKRTAVIDRCINKIKACVRENRERTHG